jgi:hypothetical protein
MSLLQFEKSKGLLIRGAKRKETSKSQGTEGGAKGRKRLEKHDRLVV